MQFKLDFDDLETLEKLLREVSDSVQEFETAFSNIIEEISDEASAETMNKIKTMADEMVPEINKIAEGYNTQADIAKKYIDGIRDINEDKTGVYELDTGEVSGYIKNTTKQLNKTENLNKETNALSDFTSSYDSKVSEYNNVEASIDLEEDYKDDEDTKALIRAKRVEIENHITNYNSNQSQLESAQTTLSNLHSTMVDYIDDLSGYKDILEDIKDFEESFNPGFWDKHGGQVMTAISIVGLVVAEPFAVIFDGIELAVAVGQSGSVAGAVMTLIPGDKILGKAGNFLKKTDEEVAKAGKQIFKESDELEPGQFVCMR